MFVCCVVFSLLLAVLWSFLACWDFKCCFNSVATLITQCSWEEFNKIPFQGFIPFFLFITQWKPILLWHPNSCETYLLPNMYLLVPDFMVWADKKRMHCARHKRQFRLHWASCTSRFKRYSKPILAISALSSNCLNTPQKHIKLFHIFLKK